MGIRERLAARMRERSALHSDFQHALTREILLTDRLRVKVLIMTASLLGTIILAAYLIVPDNVQRIWHGGFTIQPMLATIVPFVIFELWVLRQLAQRIAAGGDIPYVRR